MKILIWKFHVADSTEIRYDMILRGYILTSLGMNLKCSAHMVDVTDHGFKSLMDKNIKPEESLINLYVE